MTTKIDLTGYKFGMLTVISCVGKNKRGERLWECKCDCGNKTTVITANLKSGHTQSCGCLVKEKLAKVNASHKLCGEKIYRTWTNMKTRCFNPNVPEYRNYGAKGITVCDEWKEFEPFYNWAMVNGYSNELFIERIDSKGDYEPSNCRWADRIEQNNNTSRNRFVEYNGEVNTVSQWSRILGIKYQKLYSDLIRKHKTIEEVKKEKRGIYK